jgi:Na+/H+ antiporter NhaD/arsenite permease-like protein
MVDENIRVPKKGERVGAQGQDGTFIVSRIFTKRRTANLKLIGPVDHALREIPWEVLIFFSQPRRK